MKTDLAFLVESWIDRSSQSSSDKSGLTITARSDLVAMKTPPWGSDYLSFLKTWKLDGKISLD